MVVMVFIFLAVHIFVAPYDNRDFFVLDRLETLSLVSTFVLLMTKLFLELRRTSDSSTWISRVVWNPFWESVLWILVVIINLFFWLVAIRSIFRNSLMKLVQMKAECAPERL